MNRRNALTALCAAAGVSGLHGTRLLAQEARSPPPNAWEAAGTLRIAATWREAGDPSGTRIGVLALEPAQRQVRILWSKPLPSRAHGIVVEPTGSLLVAAVRPGRWLQRYAPSGELLHQLTLDDRDTRHLAGHVLPAAAGTLLYTTETDARDDAGWISLRDARSFERLDQWRTHGVDPHHLLLDAQGHLVVANGGILRTRNDDKRELARMDSSLVRLHHASGELLGQWRLPDRRLSLRHLAWTRSTSGSPSLLGIGLQAEHDSIERRREAPPLAVWDGQRLSVPSHAAIAEGYAGDICAVDDGFVLSSNKVNGALWWHASQPGKLMIVAKMQEAYALDAASGTALAGGALIAAARGVGLWHPSLPAMMLPWPRPMALENHWAALPAPA